MLKFGREVSLVQCFFFKWVPGNAGKTLGILCVLVVTLSTSVVTLNYEFEVIFKDALVILKLLSFE